MRRHDAATVDCFVFCYREGLLSPVGHDLKLRVTGLSAEIDDEARTVGAVFDAASLRVVAAMRDGREAPDALSAGDRADIERRMQRDVLEVSRHPEIRFRTTRVAESGDGWQVEGLLALHGRERPVAFAARREGDRLVARVRLHQPDWGIKPYSAMLGTLKVQPDLDVVVSLPQA